MASPQVEEGFVRIANELLDEILSRRFTMRQIAILMFIIRLSYGCNRTNAVIPKKRYFEIIGIDETHIEQELKYLERVKVITRKAKLYAIQKDHSIWQVSRRNPRHIIDPDTTLIELVSMNLMEPEDQKGRQHKMNFNDGKRKKLATTASSNDKKNFPKVLNKNLLKGEVSASIYLKDNIKTCSQEDYFRYAEWIQKTLVNFFNVTDPRFDKQIETIVNALGVEEAIEQSRRIVSQYQESHGKQPHYSYVFAAVCRIAGEKVSIEPKYKKSEGMDDSVLNPFLGGKNGKES